MNMMLVNELEKVVEAVNGVEKVTFTFEFEDGSLALLGCKRGDLLDVVTGKYSIEAQDGIATDFAKSLMQLRQYDYRLQFADGTEVAGTTTKLEWKKKKLKPR